jgi:dTDP-4-dehydrorhamnose 3,5-epimerase-like enzyme
LVSVEPIIANCALHRLDRIADRRGALVAVEARRQVPFQIERVYYLFETAAGAERGFHAHIALQQFAICVAGACTIVLDDGRQRRDVRLEDPSTGLFIGEMIWREMKDFTPGAVLMVLASAHYDEMDYIRDYEGFLARVAQREPS